MRELNVKIVAGIRGADQKTAFVSLSAVICRNAACVMAKPLAAQHHRNSFWYSGRRGWLWRRWIADGSLPLRALKPDGGPIGAAGSGGANCEAARQVDR
ncbi:hypothetical protein LBMAG49_02710 [Planctomycetota bacterium]|nr:hypothetical protein LBMAG49_02710 [Planctomycetota bacterium]